MQRTASPFGGGYDRQKPSAAGTLREVLLRRVREEKKDQDRNIRYGISKFRRSEHLVKREQVNSIYKSVGIKKSGAFHLMCMC